jgi:hypothetical protein
MPAGNGPPAPPTDAAFEGADDEMIIKEERKAAAVVISGDSILHDEHVETVVQTIDPKIVSESRRTGDHPKLERKVQKETQPRGEVPWQTQDPDSPPGQPADEGVSLADGGNVPTGADFVPPDVAAAAGPADAPEHTPSDAGPVPIEDVPTGLARRVTGAQAAFNPSGTSDEERAAAVGQELVSTGDVDPEEAEDLRKQPTDIRRSNGAGLQQAAADAFQPMGHDQATVVRGGEVNTGVLGAPEAEGKKPKKAGGARKMIAFLLLAMASGFGYVALKNPVLVRAKINEALVKYKLKKPAPPPTDQPPAQVEDGQPPAANAAVAAADVSDGGDDEEYSDGGDDEEDEIDAGPAVTRGDAGVGSRDAGAAAQPPPKRKKHRHVKPWWQTK